MSNTIIIYDSCGEESLGFYNVNDVDMSKYHNVYYDLDLTSNYRDPDWLELEEILINEDTVSYCNFPLECVTPNTKVIICGYTSHQK